MIIVGSPFFMQTHAQPSKISFNKTHLSQPANSTNAILDINTPTKTSNIEIQLQNSTTGSGDYVTAAIAAIGAISGGGIGSYLTYRYGRTIEQQKEQNEKTRETQFNENIKHMVCFELRRYSDFITSLEVNSLTLEALEPGADPIMDIRILSSRTLEQSSAVLLDNFNRQLMSFPKNFTQLSVEIKAKVFSGTSLPMIEAAYQLFLGFRFVPTGPIGNKLKYSGSYRDSEVRHLLKYINDALTSIDTMK
jgi:hypothetical protein